jgi:hypothetical protein
MGGAESRSTLGRTMRSSYASDGHLRQVFGVAECAQEVTWLKTDALDSEARVTTRPIH